MSALQGPKYYVLVHVLMFQCHTVPLPFTHWRHQDKDLHLEAHLGPPITYYHIQYCKNPDLQVKSWKKKSTAGIHHVDFTIQDQNNTTYGKLQHKIQILNCRKDMIQRTWQSIKSINKNLSNLNLKVVNQTALNLNVERTL